MKVTAQYLGGEPEVRNLGVEAPSHSFDPPPGWWTGRAGGQQPQLGWSWMS